MGSRHTNHGLTQILSWAHTNHGLTKKNSITREAFQDVFAVLYIMAHRDYAPGVPVKLSETGGDVVEDLCSALGSMTMNKRTYNILEAL
jgi:hypothetical protein